MSYKYILLDVDGTLINFIPTYYSAIGKLLEFGGLPANTENIEKYYSLSDEVWFGMKLDDVYNPVICRNYHPMYLEYFYKTNEKALITMNLKRNAMDLTDYFIRELGNSAIPSPNALNVCLTLFEQHELCIASNGLTDLQLSKLTAFKPYITHYFISEDMDCIKPKPKFFRRILNSLKCSPSDCLMVGDSLQNDIAGANRLGIASCFYNPTGILNTTEITPDYEIRDFSELLNIVQK